LGLANSLGNSKKLFTKKGVHRILGVVREAGVLGFGDGKVRGLKGHLRFKKLGLFL